jgi:hypothetical protein
LDRINEYEKLNKKAECITYQDNNLKSVQELKIDPELRDLLPPLTEDEFKGLEKLILEEGCKQPITLWQGYIADGHNRYEICARHSISFETEDLPLIYKEDVKDWMINHQLGKRNVSLTQISYLRGLQYEREKARHGGDRKSEDIKSSGESCHLKTTSQKLAEQHKVSERTIRDDAEFARAVDKIAENVGVATKNKILNKDIQISKDDVKVLAKMNIETQKKLLIENDNKKVAIPKPEFKAENHKVEEKQEKKAVAHSEESDKIKEIIKEIKTPKYVEIQINISDELDCFHDNVNEFIETISEVLFERYDIEDLISQEEKQKALDYTQKIINKLNTLNNKISLIKIKEIE